MAESPDEWFSWLGGRGCRGLRLACGSAPAEGAVWWVLALAPSGRPAGWRPGWDLGNREAADRRIWRVTYRRTGRGPSLREGEAVATSAERLRHSLEGITRFCEAHAGGAFRETFAAARHVLEGGPLRGYHQDLAPGGLLPADALRLLDACQVAWVFGGMGSWNDQVFHGAIGEEFARVTDAHWKAVSFGIVAAANASAG